MSVCTEVKRTLVKSPPELWSELSVAESLARHLGDLEGVRITRAEPESAVEWESDGARGSVQLEPSGFGTKVILSLTRELPEPDRPAAPDPVANTTGEPDPVANTAAEPVANTAAEPDPLANTAGEPEATGRTQAEPEPVEQTTVEFEMAILEERPVEEASVEETRERRPGFFARLFRRRHNHQSSPLGPVAKRVAPASELGAASDREPSELLAWPAQEPEQEAAPEPEPEPDPVEPRQVEREPTDIAGDLAAAEAQMAEQDTALLTTVLDHLGAAHHRPFSRG